MATVKFKVKFPQPNFKLAFVFHVDKPLNVALSQ